MAWTNERQRCWAVGTARSGMARTKGTSVRNGLMICRSQLRLHLNKFMQWNETSLCLLHRNYTFKASQMLGSVHSFPLIRCISRSLRNFFFLSVCALNRLSRLDANCNKLGNSRVTLRAPPGHSVNFNNHKNTNTKEKFVLNTKRVIFSLQLFFALLLMTALQFLVDFNLFQNCPPLFSILRLASPVPYVHVL
jgi:hypothetical protein